MKEGYISSIVLNVSAAIFNIPERRETKDKMKWRDPICENKATTIKTSGAGAGGRALSTSTKVPIMKSFRLCTFQYRYSVRLLTQSRPRHVPSIKKKKSQVRFAQSSILI